MKQAEPFEGKIPVAAPNIGEDELKLITECVTSGWISSLGPNVKLFEQEFAEWMGVPSASTCCNGTAALELAIAALKITGKKILVPTHTMIACPNAIVRTGNTPVWVDSTAEDWNICPIDMERKIDKDTVAVMIIHTFGRPANPKCFEVADKYGLKVIEDCAEALGSGYYINHELKRVGTLGDVGAFSFYANKNMTTSEGGMVISKNPETVARAKYLAQHAFTYGTHFWHKEIGWNYRMTALQASIGLAQIRRLNWFLFKKKQIAEWYRQYGVPIQEERDGTYCTYWMFSILVNNREPVMENLYSKGIESRTFFNLCNKQPYFKERGETKYPMANILERCGMYLPSSTLLTEADVKFVADSLNEVAEYR